MTEPLSIEHDGHLLGPTLARLGQLIGAGGSPHAVTMTAELSQRFRSKAEGVAFVLDALEHAFPAATMHVLDTFGQFRSTNAARARPLDVAASNWMATALAVSARHPDVILLDMGSTTTDIIPISAGAVQPLGRTDPDRLASSELVYSGALRTPVEALVRSVPWRDGMALVAADDFAHTADVHHWLGTLSADAFLTPDGAAPSRDRTAERLARIVCADRSMISDDGITAIAQHVADAQVDAIAVAIGRVRARHPRLEHAIALGLGAPIAARAARRAGLLPLPDGPDWDTAASRAAPAVAVARLLHQLHA